MATGGRQNPRRANGTRRDRIRAELAHSGRPCGICGQAIDYSAPYRLPTGGINAAAFVVDEIVPVSRGGNPLDIANCQPAHYACNARKGNRMPGDRAAPAPVARSREW